MQTVKIGNWKIKSFFGIVLMVLLGLLFIFPIYWMVISSVEPNWLVSSWPPVMYPRVFTTETFMKIIGQPDTTPIIRWLFNSVLAASFYAVLSVLVDALAAYSLARLKFRGRKFLLAAIIASLGIPAIMFFLPNYTTISALGWLNHYPAIILTGLSLPFGVFLLHQFFKTLPRELEESASIDGAGTIRTLFTIIMPVAKTGIITLGVLNFLFNWKDYFWPLLVMYEPHMMTLPVGMATLQGTYVNYVNIQMAGAVITIVPSVIVFALVQKYYREGIITTGIKG